jgi:hypothetical protein
LKHLSERRRTLAVVICACLLLGGCAAGDGTPERDASPTATFTPTGDVLLIEGKPVRQVFIPDPSQGPLYALTDELLFVRAGSGWEPTRTRNDGRQLLVDALDPERVFRGNHPECALDPAAAAIPLEVSHDGGATWRTLPQGENIRPLAIDPETPETIFGSFCWLAISTTAGNTWMRLQLMEEYPLVAIALAGERLLVLGTAAEGGSRLAEVDIIDPNRPVLGDTLLDVDGRACLEADLERIVVGAIDGVYVSDDGGLTWSESRIGLEAVTAEAVPDPERPAGEEQPTDLGIRVVRIGRRVEHRIYAGTAHGLFISQDDGATWVRYEEIPPTAVVDDIQFGGDGADLYVTTADGVVVIPSP